MATSIKRKAGSIIPSSIDIQVECSALSYDDLSKAPTGEPSSVIRERVLKSGAPVPRAKGHTLQCPDDRAHDSPIRRTQRKFFGPPSHGNGTPQTFRPCLQPHPEGGPHHRRPRRQREGRSHAHRRGHRVQKSE